MMAKRRNHWQARQPVRTKSDALMRRGSCLISWLWSDVKYSRTGNAELSKGRAALSVLWVHHQSTCQEERGLAGPAQPARVQADGGGEL